MEKHSDTLSITLKLGSYIFPPMTVKREDEIVYREAEKLLNQRYSYYANRYPRLGNEMYLAMMALDVAVQLKDMERSGNLEPVLGRLNALLQEVEETLHK